MIRTLLNFLAGLIFCSLTFHGFHGIRAEETVYPPPDNIRNIIRKSQYLRQTLQLEFTGPDKLEQALVIGEHLRKSWPGPPEIDPEEIQPFGIRLLRGKHLLLWTDLPSSPEVDQLAGIFDLAVPEYCRYFHIDPVLVEDWQVVAFLIKDRKIFDRSGLMRGAPRFLNGHSMDYRIWINDPPSDYYRRHLLIHEGVHAFMNYMFGTCGPPWYMEAMAEYLGTHRWEEGRLTLGIMPKTSKEVTDWGRIDLIRESVAQGNRKLPDGIFQFAPSDYERTATYAWSWGIAFFFDNHPGTQRAFRDNLPFVTFPDFTQRLWKSLQNDWTDLNNGWIDFTSQLAYGYEMERTLMDFTPGRPPGENPVTFSVDSTCGWQNSGIVLQRGQKYLITASGRFQLGTQPKIWWAEAEGVTVRYHNGLPLGTLMAVVVPVKTMSQPGETPPGIVFDTPIRIGSSAELVPDETGILFFRINDSPGELDENQGFLEVEISISQS